MNLKEDERDPAVALPPELFERILLYFSVRELLRLSVVSSLWNEASNSSAIWRSFLVTHLFAEENPNEKRYSDYHQPCLWLDNMEREEDGRNLARETYQHFTLRMNEWKVYFIMKLCFTRMIWASNWEHAPEFLDISPDCKTCFVSMRQGDPPVKPISWAWGSFGFTTGVYYEYRKI